MRLKWKGLALFSPLVFALGCAGEPEEEIPGSTLAPLAPHALASPGPVLVGVVKPFWTETPHPYPRGTDARSVVWTEEVTSPGATFLRIHLSRLSLGEGDYVTVASRDGTRSWTYRGTGPHGTGDVWAFAVEGDTARVELHGGPKPGHGFVVDAVGHGVAPGFPEPELTCGSDGREDVACHLTESGFNAAQRPVARLLFVSGAYLYACTGWLVRGSSASTLMTNYHCLSRQKEVNTLQATFNYQRTTCGGSTFAATTDYAGGTLLKTSSLYRRGSKGGLDYTLLTLQGNPEATWGELVPTTKAVSIGDLIWFIQHPGGNEKKVGYWEDAAHTQRCNVDDTNATYGGTAIASQTAYSCDSQGGSSGSPIVDASTGRVIALHHFGGVDYEPCLNSGTAMAPICADAGPALACASD
ncbi:MAG: trypsin-like peptidase domain-containing protein [Deltaproteobacteria bacterium]|nr:trypsin-like peptidase domain-containing protein [Deltaproteobacteria bacterium]